MTPEEQSYIDNVADTMDQETAKVYLEYEALKVKLRDDVKVIGHRAKYKAIWLGIMILSIPLWGYVIAQYWNWFVSLAGFHTITWLQGYCLVFAFQMLRTNFGRIESNDPFADYLHKMVDGDFTDADKYNMPDSVYFAIMAIASEFIPPLFGLFFGWVLSCFLYA